MAEVAGTAPLDGLPEFLADAVEHLALCIGQSHPNVTEGRRILASLAAIPSDAVLVTEETLAAAIHRAWPVRRKSPTESTLAAASILAAIRAAP